MTAADPTMRHDDIRTSAGQGEASGRDCPAGVVVQTTRTHYAPAGRAPPAALQRRTREVAGTPLLQALLESADGYCMILNQHRQVLAANDRVLTDLGLEELARIVGLRPGEVFDCVHHVAGPDGCGTGRACASCGALDAVLQAQRSGIAATREGLLTLHRQGQLTPLELRVRATPVEAKSGLLVVVLTDLSDKKRREVLENAFFHDVMNVVGGLVGWSRVLEKIETADPRLAAARIVNLATRLQLEIEAHRELALAESGELQPRLEPTSVAGVFEAVRQVFAAHPSATERRLEVVAVEPDATVATDAKILLRVLINAVKNALEASEDGAVARLWFEQGPDLARFRVHNAGAIPPEVVPRVFQRSFTTKGGDGRGLGTYSMRLLCTRYLGGSVTFASDADAGTTFTIALPWGPPPDPPPG